MPTDVRETNIKRCRDATRVLAGSLIPGKDRAPGQPLGLAVDHRTEGGKEQGQRPAGPLHTTSPQQSTMARWQLPVPRVGSVSSSLESSPGVSLSSKRLRGFMPSPAAPEPRSRTTLERLFLCRQGLSRRRHRFSRELLPWLLCRRARLQRQSPNQSHRRGKHRYRRTPYRCRSGSPTRRNRSRQPRP